MLWRTVFGIANNMTEDRSESGNVKSVFRAVKILELLAEKNSLGITEISRFLGLPKSSVYEILSTLLAENILEKDHDRNTYNLGLKLFELGITAQKNLEIKRIATPHIRKLNELLDETVHLTVLEDDEVLYIDCFESTKRLRTYSVIGVKAPLHCTAVGKAMLAYLSSDEVDRIIKEKGLERFTSQTLSDPEALKKDLETIRSRGYSFDNMEHEEWVRCVAAPVRNHEGRVFASISVSGPVQRMPAERDREVIRLLLEETREISRKLGFRES
ncbi:MAG: IclR family transcriptional regulator [Spirochaetales bacterium]|nr:MAG: IclR family transcriptional regulator [Spirochaetales bacterium]